MMWRCVPLGFIFVGVFVFYYLGFYHYFNFETLKTHHHFLLQWTNTHYVKAVGIYVCLYILAVVLSVPGIFLFTLLGGFLFGIWQGVIYDLVSVTVGALLVFFAVKLSLADWFKKISGERLKKLEKGFQEGAFSYILMLRLTPLFPSWLVDVSSALLGAKPLPFAVATVLGIFPATVIYVTLGSRFGRSLDIDQAVGFDMLLQPSILFLLTGLALLALLPMALKYYQHCFHQGARNSTL